jgi:hypothetical protein
MLRDILTAIAVSGAALLARHGRQQGAIAALLDRLVTTAGKSTVSMPKLDLGPAQRDP